MGSLLVADAQPAHYCLLARNAHWQAGHTGPGRPVKPVVAIEVSAQHGQTVVPPEHFAIDFKRRHTEHPFGDSFVSMGLELGLDRIITRAARRGQLLRKRGQPGGVGCILAADPDVLEHGLAHIAVGATLRIRGNARRSSPKGLKGWAAGKSSVRPLLCASHCTWR